MGECVGESEGTNFQHHGALDDKGWLLGFMPQEI